MYYEIFNWTIYINQSWVYESAYPPKRIIRVPFLPIEIVVWGKMRGDYDKQ